MKNKLIRQIMEHEVFRHQPPVLVDVGASGEIHEEWAEIAPYSLCIAFDGDDREFKSDKSSESGYRELILYHRVLTAKEEEKCDFFLTVSPYCSSTLPPDTAGLKPYSFRPFFEVEKQLQLKSVTLNEVLKENSLDYIDWFKTDSQGTDLRLFASLPEAVAEKVKIADFEPGIIDAYCGEDKFYDLLKWMNGKNFFLDTLDVECVYRIQPETLQSFQLSSKVWRYAKPTPGWVNLTFLSNGAGSEAWTLRDTLFFMVCCLIKKQYGMLLEFASEAKKRFPEEEKIFSAAAEKALKELKPSFFTLCRRTLCRKLISFLRRKCVL